MRPVLPGPLAALGDLATNLRWSWHHPTQDLFASIDPEVWEEVSREEHFAGPDDDADFTLATYVRR